MAISTTACGQDVQRLGPPPQYPYEWRVPREGETFLGGYSDAGAAALALAVSQVGKRYCWGGTGPECFDCSGLVDWAWSAVGVRLPRTADAMPAVLPEIPLSEIRPGDILWWPGHVGLYAGAGWQVEALDRRDGVVLRHLRRPHRAMRPL